MYTEDKQEQVFAKGLPEDSFKQAVLLIDFNVKNVFNEKFQIY